MKNLEQYQLHEHMCILFRDNTIIHNFSKKWLKFKINQNLKSAYLVDDSQNVCWLFVAEHLAGVLSM